MAVPKLTVVSGHLGSGKTEFSLNYATTTRAAEPGRRVALCDLDFINPYFRSRKHREALEAAGVELVTPDSADVSTADIPSVSGRIKALIDDPSASVILEVGGDDVGATVLGHLNASIRARGFDHYMVLNLYRPDTDEREKVLAMVRAIERASNLPVTGLILNNHLMYETSYEDVADGYERASAMDLSSTPVRYVCVSDRFRKEAAGLRLRGGEKLFPLRRFLRYVHEN